MGCLQKGPLCLGPTVPTPHGLTSDNAVRPHQKSQCQTSA